MRKTKDKNLKMQHENETLLKKDLMKNWLKTTG